MKMKKHLVILFAALFLAIPSSMLSNYQDSVIFTDNGNISIYNNAETLTGGTLHTRKYNIFNGDQVMMGSYVNNGFATGTTLVARFSTGSNSGFVKYYDRTNGKWVTLDLKEGSYSASMICVSTDTVNYFFYTPRAWKIHINSTLEEISNRNGYLYVRNSSDGFIVELYSYNLADGYRSDFTCVSSNNTSLINWSHSNAENFWKNYTLEGEGKWCFDGYYFPAATTYIPSGANYYFRLPGSYLLRSFLNAQHVHRVALDMSLSMMDTLILHQNGTGFFATMSGSTWLQDDYNIGPEFYDTRFNSDLIELIIRGHSLYGGDLYYESLQTYADFFINYANSHHRTTSSGGWFVDDYYHTSGNLPTHTSLNHQLAEIIVLYKLSDKLERPELSTLADRMLLAIEDTGENWILQNKNLHYSYSASGTYGGNDYPYLTYNDMYDLQELLIARNGKTNDTLTMLMESKRAWMDSNSITGYKSKS